MNQKSFEILIKMALSGNLQSVLSKGKPSQALVELDAETRYMARSARGKGSTERGLELLRKAQTE